MAALDRDGLGPAAVRRDSESDATTSMSPRSIASAASTTSDVTTSTATTAEEEVRKRNGVVVSDSDTATTAETGSRGPSLGNAASVGATPAVAGAPAATAAAAESRQSRTSVGPVGSMASGSKAGSKTSDGVGGAEATTTVPTQAPDPPRPPIARQLSTSAKSTSVSSHASSSPNISVRVDYDFGGKAKSVLVSQAAVAAYERLEAEAAAMDRQQLQEEDEVVSAKEKLGREQRERIFGQQSYNKSDHKLPVSQTSDPVVRERTRKGDGLMDEAMDTADQPLAGAVGVGTKKKKGRRRKRKPRLQKSISASLLQGTANSRAKIVSKSHSVLSPTQEDKLVDEDRRSPLSRRDMRPYSRTEQQLARNEAMYSHTANPPSRERSATEQNRPLSARFSQTLPHMVITSSNHNVDETAPQSHSPRQQEQQHQHQHQHQQPHRNSRIRRRRIVGDEDGIGGTAYQSHTQPVNDGDKEEQEEDGQAGTDAYEVIAPQDSRATPRPQQEHPHPRWAPPARYNSRTEDIVLGKHKYAEDYVAHPEYESHTIPVSDGRAANDQPQQPQPQQQAKRGMRRPRPQSAHQNRSTGTSWSQQHYQLGNSMAALRRFRELVRAQAAEDEFSEGNGSKQRRERGQGAGLRAAPLTEAFVAPKKDYNLEAAVSQKLPTDSATAASNAIDATIAKRLQDSAGQAGLVIPSAVHVLQARVRRALPVMRQPVHCMLLVVDRSLRVIATPNSFDTLPRCSVPGISVLGNESHTPPPECVRVLDNSWDVASEMLARRHASSAMAAVSPGQQQKLGSLIEGSPVIKPNLQAQQQQQQQQQRQRQQAEDAEEDHPRALHEVSLAKFTVNLAAVPEEVYAIVPVFCASPQQPFVAPGAFNCQVLGDEGPKAWVNRRTATTHTAGAKRQPHASAKSSDKPALADFAAVSSPDGTTDLPRQKLHHDPVQRSWHGWNIRPLDDWSDEDDEGGSDYGGGGSEANTTEENPMQQSPAERNANADNAQSDSPDADDNNCPHKQRFPRKGKHGGDQLATVIWENGKRGHAHARMQPAVVVHLAEGYVPFALMRGPTATMAWVLKPMEARVDAAATHDLLEQGLRVMREHHIIPYHIVHIEHCTNCEQHRMTTWHVPGEYEKHAKDVAATVRARLPPCVIVANQRAKPRVGSFEISVQRYGAQQTQLVFSKLATGRFPSKKEVLVALSAALVDPATYFNPRDAPHLRIQLVDSYRNAPVVNAVVRVYRVNTLWSTADDVCGDRTTAANNTDTPPRRAGGPPSPYQRRRRPNGSDRPAPQEQSPPLPSASPITTGANKQEEAPPTSPIHVRPEDADEHTQDRSQSGSELNTPRSSSTPKECRGDDGDSQDPPLLYTPRTDEEPQVGHHPRRCMGCEHGAGHWSPNARPLQEWQDARTDQASAQQHEHTDSHAEVAAREKGKPVDFENPVRYKVQVSRRDWHRGIGIPRAAHHGQASTQEHQQDHERDGRKRRAAAQRIVKGLRTPGYNMVRGWGAKQVLEFFVAHRLTEDVIHKIMHRDKVTDGLRLLAVTEQDLERHGVLRKVDRVKVMESIRALTTERATSAKSPGGTLNSRNGVDASGIGRMVGDHNTTVLASSGPGTATATSDSANQNNNAADDDGVWHDQGQPMLASDFLRAGGVGNVFSASGLGADGASVMTRKRFGGLTPRRPGSSQFELVGQGTTDESGRFSFRVMDSGSYFLSCENELLLPGSTCLLHFPAHADIVWSLEEDHEHTGQEAKEKSATGGRAGGHRDKARLSVPPLLLALPPRVVSCRVELHLDAPREPYRSIVAWKQRPDTLRGIAVALINTQTLTKHNAITNEAGVAMFALPEGWYMLSTDKRVFHISLDSKLSIKVNAAVAKWKTDRLVDRGIRLFQFKAREARQQRVAAVLRIQSIMRTVQKRNSLTRMRISLLRIQALCRAFLARSEYKHTMYMVIKLQSFCRMALEGMRFRRQLFYTVRLQSMIRGYVHRRRARRVRAARTLKRFGGWVACRCWYLRTIHGVCVLQSIYRGWEPRANLHRHHTAAVVIQANAKGMLYRMRLRRGILAVVVLQRQWRAHVFVRRNLKNYKPSSASASGSRRRRTGRSKQQRQQRQEEEEEEQTAPVTAPGLSQEAKARSFMDHVRDRISRPESRSNLDSAAASTDGDATSSVGQESVGSRYAYLRAKLGLGRGSDSGREEEDDSPAMHVSAAVANAFLPAPDLSRLATIESFAAEEQSESDARGDANVDDEGSSYYRPASVYSAGGAGEKWDESTSPARPDTETQRAHGSAPAADFDEEEEEGADDDGYDAEERDKQRLEDLRRKEEEERSAQKKREEEAAALQEQRRREEKEREEREAAIRDREMQEELRRSREALYGPHTEPILHLPPEATGALVMIRLAPEFRPLKKLPFEWCFSVVNTRETFAKSFRTRLVRHMSPGTSARLAFSYYIPDIGKVPSIWLSLIVRRIVTEKDKQELEDAKKRRKRHQHLHSSKHIKRYESMTNPSRFRPTHKGKIELAPYYRAGGMQLAYLNLDVGKHFHLPDGYREMEDCLPHALPLWISVLPNTMPSSWWYKDQIASVVDRRRGRASQTAGQKLSAALSPLLDAPVIEPLVDIRGASGALWMITKAGPSDSEIVFACDEAGVVFSVSKTLMATKSNNLAPQLSVVGQLPIIAGAENRDGEVVLSSSAGGTDNAEAKHSPHHRPLHIVPRAFAASNQSLLQRLEEEEEEEGEEKADGAKSSSEHKDASEAGGPGAKASTVAVGSTEGESSTAPREEVRPREGYYMLSRSLNVVDAIPPGPKGAPSRQDACTTLTGGQFSVAVGMESGLVMFLDAHSEWDPIHLMSPETASMVVAAHNLPMKGLIDTYLFSHRDGTLSAAELAAIPEQPKVKTHVEDNDTAHHHGSTAADHPHVRGNIVQHFTLSNPFGGRVVVAMESVYVKDPWMPSVRLRGQQNARSLSRVTKGARVGGPARFDSLNDDAGAARGNSEWNMTATPESKQGGTRKGGERRADESGSGGNDDSASGSSSDSDGESDSGSSDSSGSSSGDESDSSSGSSNNSESSGNSSGGEGSGAGERKRSTEHKASRKVELTDNPNPVFALDVHPPYSWSVIGLDDGHVGVVDLTDVSQGSSALTADLVQQRTDGVVLLPVFGDRVTSLTHTVLSNVAEQESWMSVVDSRLLPAQSAHMDRNAHVFVVAGGGFADPTVQVLVVRLSSIIVPEKDPTVPQGERPQDVRYTLALDRMARMEGHTGSVDSVAVDGAFRYIVSGSSLDGTIRTWSVGSFSCERVINNASPVCMLIYSSMLWVGCDAKVAGHANDGNNSVGTLAPSMTLWGRADARGRNAVLSLERDEDWIKAVSKLWRSPHFLLAKSAGEQGQGVSRDELALAKVATGRSLCMRAHQAQAKIFEPGSRAGAAAADATGIVDPANWAVEDVPLTGSGSIDWLSTSAFSMTQSPTDTAHFIAPYSRTQVLLGKTFKPPRLNVAVVPPSSSAKVRRILREPSIDSNFDRLLSNAGAASTGAGAGAGSGAADDNSSVRSRTSTQRAVAPVAATAAVSAAATAGVFHAAPAAVPHHPNDQASAASSEDHDVKDVQVDWSLAFGTLSPTKEENTDADPVLDSSPATGVSALAPHAAQRQSQQRHIRTPSQVQQGQQPQTESPHSVDQFRTSTAAQEYATHGLVARSKSGQTASAGGQGPGYYNTPYPDQHAAQYPTADQYADQFADRYPQHQEHDFDRLALGASAQQNPTAAAIQPAYGDGEEEYLMQAPAVPPPRTTASAAHAEGRQQDAGERSVVSASEGSSVVSRLSHIKRRRVQWSSDDDDEDEEEEEEEEKDHRAAVSVSNRASQRGVSHDDDDSHLTGRGSTSDSITVQSKRGTTRRIRYVDVDSEEEDEGGR